jgi:formylmethanofuran dehydrogenase subunit D
MKTKLEQYTTGDDSSFFLKISQEFIKELGWEEGDEVKVETTLDCYPSGEITSIIIANVTKNQDILVQDANKR